MTATSQSARLRGLSLIPVVALLGLGMKSYHGPGAWWLNNWGASVAYEIFFMLILFAGYPRRGAITRIAVGVCLATVVLEFLQLWRTPVLDAVRSTFVGRSLLGNVFAWSDLPAYPLGCLLGWFLLRAVSGAGRLAGDATR